MPAALLLGLFSGIRSKVNVDEGSMIHFGTPNPHHNNLRLNRRLLFRPDSWLSGLCGSYCSFGSRDSAQRAIIDEIPFFSFVWLQACTCSLRKQPTL